MSAELMTESNSVAVEKTVVVELSIVAPMSFVLVFYHVYRLYDHLPAS